MGLRQPSADIRRDDGRRARAHRPSPASQLSSHPRDPRRRPAPHRVRQPAGRLSLLSVKIHR